MSNRIKRLHIVHCKMVITQQRSYCRSFCFCVLKSHLTPLFISSYDFAANVINESTQRLCVGITILFSSLTFAASSKKAKFFICDSGNRFCSGSSTTLRKMNLYIYSQPLLFLQEFHLKRSLKFQMSGTFPILTVQQNTMLPMQIEQLTIIRWRHIQKELLSQIFLPK